MNKITFVYSLKHNFNVINISMQQPTCFIPNQGIFGAPFVCMSTANLHILVSAFYKIYICKHHTSSNAILSLKMYISTIHHLKFMGKKCKTFVFLTETALHLIQVNSLLFMLHDLDKCQYFSDKNNITISIYN
jgi:hypothetical protein